MLKEEYKIMQSILKYNTAGYNYDNNKRINYSGYYKSWYCKDFINNKMNTYNITRNEAIIKIKNSFV
jgi:hypothetical protein